MFTDSKPSNIHSFLDERSRCVYQLRIDQQKSFREIGITLGLSHSRAHQLYQAIAKSVQPQMNRNTAYLLGRCMPFIGYSQRLT